MSSENSSSSSKKKKIVASAIAVALAAALMIGGTISYLQDDDGVVVNSFEVQTVDVEIDEDTGSDYEIIPGTSQEKDPHVDVDVDVASYVFVLIEDDTEDLVTYSIADGWTELEGTEDNALNLPENITVYYRTVEAGTDATYYILADNKVSYSSTLTNDDMLNAGDDLTLSFSAIVVQQSDNFSSALEAFQASYGVDVGSLLSSDDSDSSVSVTWYGTVDSISVSTTDEDGNITEAVITINGNGTLVVSSDVTASIVVESGSDAAIELSDDTTLTSESTHTVYVEEDASLDISGGTIDATKHAMAAVYNAGGTVTISDTTITRSNEAGSSSSDNGGNSYYYVANYGTMTLEDCIITSSGAYSSLILNCTDDDATTVAHLTIDGGTYSGGLNTIKNSAGAILTIEDGTFTNSAQHLLLNSGMATINGGTFTASASGGAVVYNWYYGTDASSYDLYDEWYTATDSTVLMPAILRITGGTFTSTSSYAIQSVYSSNWGQTDIKVSGGTFDDSYIIYTTSLTYLADGYVLQSNNDGTYSVVLSSSSDDE